MKQFETWYDCGMFAIQYLKQVSCANMYFIFQVGIVSVSFHKPAFFLSTKTFQLS